MPKNKYPESNRQFRAALAAINPNCRDNFERTLQELLGYKSLSSVRRMTREGATTRSFFSDYLTPEAFALRELIARLVIASAKPHNAPTKDTLFSNGEPKKNAEKLRKYLQTCDYTKENAVKFTFHGGDGSFSFSYDNYGGIVDSDSPIDWEHTDYQDLIDLGDF